MSNEQIDIAIVGGGVSGVYSAWKLQKEFPGQKIVVFEGSDHIGGRLLSVRPPNIPDMVAELGGMRILENTQHLVVKLIADLNVILKEAGKPTIDTYDFPVDKDQNIAFLRGIYLRLADFTKKPDEVPYNLSFLENGNGPGTIIVNAIEQIVPGITDPGHTEEERREMAKNAKFDDIPLNEWGFWNLLYRVISSEAYQFSMDAGGYDSTLVNWNAADAIPWYLSDFGINPKYKGFKNGFQQVPITLADLFKAGGGDIRLNRQLAKFKFEGGPFELTFSDGEVINAGKLILAMPRRALDLLMPESPRLEQIKSLISSVTPRPLFKLFTTYMSPWWRIAGYTNAEGKFVPLESGRSVTDLPLRQTYYWPKSDGTPATGGRSMLLASYDDGNNTGFWDGLRPRRSEAWSKGGGRPKLADPFIGEGEQGAKSGNGVKDGLNQTWDMYEAPRRMVEEVARQLQQMHNLDYCPAVKDAAFRDWGEDPYGGGWNSWNIGVKSAEVRDKIVHPMDDCLLYICGEAYSDAQGWVEGALQTAEIMLPHLLNKTEAKKQAKPAAAVAP
ncbi:FAD-dependent oxidoreductase [Chitinophaga agrisoli]|uniref:FAD-dependent oxidoreductase n=1 Tax=Chitinophaga agrisoli TaxID=2607653 RepID=A0A5B2VY20_9BACT|nr:FAD-dependent oxidoreductase [Chitinophaga agrisoli]KAA2243528.1 FAD-dependent oxidoreductase [Chitinophaga agrisoli]